MGFLMTILSKTITTLALLLVTLRGAATTAPVFREITPRTQVTKNGDIYEYL